jgi:hypothetical protein
MNNELKYISKATMRVNSSPNWGHSTELAFEGNDVANFEVENKALEELLRFNQDNNFNQSKVKGSRHGSLLSVTDKSRWSLDLIAKSYSISNYTNITAPKAIEKLIETFTDSNFITSIMKENNDSAQTDGYADGRGKHEGHLMFYSIRSLMLPFYSYTVHSVRDENDKILETFKMHEVKDLFIPDITFHPISLIRNLFLAIVKPDFIDLENPIIRMDFERIRQFNKTISLNKNKNSALKELMMMDLDIREIIENGKKVLKWCAPYKDLPEPKNGWGDGSEPIKLVYRKQYYNRNGLLEQLSEENIQEIEKHFNLLKEMVSKSGEITSYLLKPLEDGSTIEDFEKESKDFRSAFDANTPPEIK